LDILSVPWLASNMLLQEKRHSPTYHKKLLIKYQKILQLPTISKFELHVR